DGLDLEAWHLLGRNALGALQACARLLPPACKGAGQQAPLIGRVLTAPELRGQGQGQALMQQALAHCARLWPGQRIELSAQAYLRDFYQALGFEAISEVYDDDGIAHIDMRKQETT
ncbi:MAG: GNAT family N-acetyltransferase, partial [Paucibacter sp.]|nr:GNAT family N-acetyltransferase [Roseateles sp.]